MRTIDKKTGITAFIAIGLGIFLGWMIFDAKPVDLKQEIAAEHTEFTHESTWICSMHPHIQKNEPGDCPICGMDLAPLEFSSTELNPMAVKMSPTAMQLAEVQTMIVGSGESNKSIRLNGKVQVDERLLFTQSTHISGRIEKLTVNFTGEFVAEGQVIAFLYSPEFVTAQEELFQAKKMRESQAELFNAAKEKLRNWKLTDKQIEQILTSEKAIHQFPILANVSGYITKKMVNLGDYVEQGQGIYEIADLSSVWVLFDVYESDMTWIKKGASISYTVQSIPGRTFEGTISFIDPVIDSKTRVAKARIESENGALLLKPEMFVSGTLEAKIKASNSLIRIPKTAVMWTGKRSVVYVMQTSEQGIGFVMREVSLGPELGESYLIESGLKEGEKIAVNGAFSIDAAAQLEGKPSMMNPEGGVAMKGHNHGAKTSTAGENMSAKSPKHTLSAEAKKSLQALFEIYFKLKMALAADDYENSKQAKMALNALLSEIDETLFEGEAYILWQQHATSLKKELQADVHSDIESLRKSFKNISIAMIALAETFDPLSTVLYVQHCSMADSNKGASWLSLEKEIRNPYYGAKMLRCGENKLIIE